MILLFVSFYKIICGKFAIHFLILAFTHVSKQLCFGNYIFSYVITNTKSITTTLFATTWFFKTLAKLSELIVTSLRSEFLLYVMVSLDNLASVFSLTCCEGGFSLFISLFKCHC